MVQYSYGCEEIKDLLNRLQNVLFSLEIYHMQITTLTATAVVKSTNANTLSDEFLRQAAKPEPLSICVLLQCF